MIKIYRIIIIILLLLVLVQVKVLVLVLDDRDKCIPYYYNVPKNDGGKA